MLLLLMTVPALVLMLTPSGTVRVCTILPGCSASNSNPSLEVTLRERSMALLWSMSNETCSSRVKQARLQAFTFALLIAAFLATSSIEVSRLLRAVSRFRAAVMWCWCARLCLSVIDQRRESAMASCAWASAMFECDSLITSNSSATFECDSMIASSFLSTLASMLSMRAWSTSANSLKKLAVLAAVTLFLAVLALLLAVRALDA
mmetsp:Transcript_13229/g.25982  ORF Transcript_13229/g.25982 Transcript_13229/m.25982 type:complete len:205 (-) Transcript_13229:204-818(-)